MSYLHLSSLNLADINKGTISLWFRFSDDSIQNAIAYGNGYPRTDIGGDRPAILKYTMPLVTFGRKVMAHVYDYKPRTFTQSIPHEPGSISHTVLQLDVKDDSPCEPSHIGIICGGEGETPNLVMRFQTATRAQVQGLEYQISEMHWVLLSGDSSYTQYYTVEDISYTKTKEPESFLVIPIFKVDVDKWHHLLVSFDFSNPVDVVAAAGDFETHEAVRSATIKSHCKIWYAFDDENKKGKNNIGNKYFGPVPGGWVPEDENGIVTQNAESAIFSYTPAISPAVDRDGNPIITGGDEKPEYHWASSQLPTKDGPMGFPASAEYVDTVYHCEMAEFQLFAGIALDTGLESNRRAFVDKDGKPVPANKKRDPADLTSYSGSIELLGKEPEILLHGSGNWKQGKNTGTLGIEINSDGEKTIFPGGQFTPTAKIEPYKPEPALTETPTG